MENKLENKVETLNPIENTHKIMTLSHLSPMQQPHLLQTHRYGYPQIWNPFRLLKGLKSATCSKLLVRDTPKYFTLFLNGSEKCTSSCQSGTRQLFLLQRIPFQDQEQSTGCSQCGVTSSTSMADRIALDGHFTVLITPNNKISAETRRCLSRHYYTLQMINTPWPEIVHKAG